MSYQTFDHMHKICPHLLPSPPPDAEAAAGGSHSLLSSANRGEFDE